AAVPVPPDLDPPTLVARALATRPELRGLAAGVHAREAEVALARRDYFPDFRLRGGYETSWQEAPLAPVVGLELNVPLQLGRPRSARSRWRRENSREEESVRLARATADRCEHRLACVLARRTRRTASRNVRGQRPARRGDDAVGPGSRGRERVDAARPRRTGR